MSMDFVCMYKCTVYFEGEESSHVECGMFQTSSLTAAVDYLENVVYGGDLLEINHLELFDALPIFSENTWNLIKEELNEKM